MERITHGYGGTPLHAVVPSCQEFGLYFFAVRVDSDILAETQTYRLSSVTLSNFLSGFDMFFTLLFVEPAVNFILL
jgi:hypothetical protein